MGNSRNGSSSKTILTEDGELEIAVPRPRWLHIRPSQELRTQYFLTLSESNRIERCFNKLKHFRRLATCVVDTIVKIDGETVATIAATLGDKWPVKRGLPATVMTSGEYFDVKTFVISILVTNVAARGRLG